MSNHAAADVSNLDTAVWPGAPAPVIAVDLDIWTRQPAMLDRHLDMAGRADVQIAGPTPCPHRPYRLPHPADLDIGTPDLDIGPVQIPPRMSKSRPPT